MTTIAFFPLDDVSTRKNLLRERAIVIVVLRSKLAETTDQHNAAARALAGSLLVSSSPHANCARSFARLFREERTEADAVAEEAENFLLSRSL